MAKSVADNVFSAAETAAQDEIAKYPKNGLSIEIDKRGAHPSMTIRVLPAVKLKKINAKGEVTKTRRSANPKDKS